MPELDRRLDTLRRLHADPSRQIALYVLDEPDAPEDDRLCAAGILGALDALPNCDYLTVKVDGLLLSSATLADAERLWRCYEEDVSESVQP